MSRHFTDVTTLYAGVCDGSACSVGLQQGTVGCTVQTQSTMVASCHNSKVHWLRPELQYFTDWSFNAEGHANASNLMLQICCTAMASKNVS